MNTQPIRVNSEQAGMTDTKACKNLAVSEDHLAASSHDIPAVTKLQDSLPGKKLRQEGDSPPPIDTTLSATESEGFIEDIPRKPRKPRTIPARKDSFIEIEPPSPKPQGIYSQRNSDLSDRSVYTDSDSDGENQTTSEIQRLQQRIQALETRLKQKSLRATTQPPPSRYQTLYEIRPNVYNDSGEDSSSPDSDCDDQYQNWRGNNWHPRQKRSSNAWPREIYMDPPVVMHDGRGIASLHCTRRLDRLNLFLASNPDISFVVFHDYNHDLDPDTREDWRPTPRAKSIYPVSKELKKALRLILEDRPEYKDIFTEYEWTNELSAPYLFIYHSRPELPKIREELSQAARDQLDLLLEFVMKELGDEYDTADSLLQRNEILPQYVQYLIKPGDILVENRNGEYTGYRAQTYPVESLRRPSIMLKQHIHGMSENRDESHHHSPDVVRKWTLSGFTWRFDGTFYGKNKQLKIEMPQNDSSLSEETQLQEAVGDDGTRVAQLKGQPIATLRVFPLRCAPDHMRKMLYHRGEMLWKCRLRRLVSYQAHEPDPTGNGMEEHCIIDMRTYQSLHPKEKPDFYVHPSRRACRLSKVDMARDGPPGDEFRLLMPPRVKGYNFWRKKWCDLKVDQISDVIWKQDAFQSLEIDYEAKTLIRALVANYLKTETSWDFIAGKGNGLIFLLHGSPGTGKTHTTESIAEIAEKPLYRVTCNDLGAKAEAVERNLESALDLGRTWGCVMLLDEADIFLEQKSLDDLERHALVSGFLRMVKSYDGIVVLTCSRVNTLNETFRSRIHLALHYPALDPYRRSLIWRRFIEQLDSSNDDMNISDVWGLAESLKDENLNGTQIRNIITNARQYARWKKVPLTHEHIKDVMEVSGRSDAYLRLHGGFAQDELAYDEWLR